MEQKVSCSFFSTAWNCFGKFYTCTIKDETIDNNLTLNIKGKHLSGKINADVEGIWFENCVVSTSFPRGLKKIFPNLINFGVINSKLSHMTRECLKEYEELNILWLTGNNIPFLSCNLFDNLTSLEVLVLSCCQIELIEPNIFNKLTKLKHLNLNNNPFINMRFSLWDPSNHNSSIAEIQEELVARYLSRAKRVLPNHIKTAEELFQKDRKINSLKVEIEYYKNKFGCIQAIMQSEEMKDFTIITQNQEFKAHKFVLAARCPYVIDLLKENIGIQSCRLPTVPGDIFGVILDFIYTNKLPDSNINCVELFKACDMLKIESLKKFSADNLHKFINPENAMDILTLSNIHGYDEMKQKSFEEIKKFLDCEQIDADLVNQPEILGELIDIKMEKIKIKQEFEEKFNAALDKL